MSQTLTTAWRQVSLAATKKSQRVPAESPWQAGTDGQGQPKGDLTTREVIIDAATKAFADHGFDRTTNKMIAVRAGVAPGLLYHYFDSKEALFAAAYSKITRYRYERSSAVVRSERTFARKIEALAQDLVEMWTNDRSYVEFHARTLFESQHEHHLSEALASARHETEQLWCGIVEDAKKHGELPSSISTMAVADMCITWSTGQVMLLASRGADRTLAATDILLSAIRTFTAATSNGVLPI
jgi:AcrR family transcriptional regulator